MSTEKAPSQNIATKTIAKLAFKLISMLRLSFGTLPKNTENESVNEIMLTPPKQMLTKPLGLSAFRVSASAPHHNEKCELNEKFIYSTKTNPAH